jgi:hypothetical protein
MGEGTRRAVVVGLEAGADHARNFHEHKKRTGDLTGARLYGRLRSGDDRGADGELVNETPYAAYVEYGTLAHIIRSKAPFGFIGPLHQGQSRRSRTDIGTHRIALRFVVGGRTVFARMVRHPGTRPMPFMYPAAEYAGEEIIFQTEHVTFVLAAALWE